MKRIIVISLLAVVIINFITLTAIAQEQKVQTYFVHDQVVKSTHVDAYERVVKDINALLIKHKSPFQINIFKTNDFHYLIAIPIEGLTPIPYYQEYNRIAQNAGSEVWGELMDRHTSAVESWSISMITSVPGLSYTPENPRLKPEEANFGHIILFYLKPDEDSQYQKIMGELAALCKRKNIPDGYQAFNRSIGADKPVRSIVIRAKDEADYYSQSKKNIGILGEEYKTLWAKIIPLLRKIERVDGFYRPDLSYTPEE